MTPVTRDTTGSHVSAASVDAADSSAAAVRGRVRRNAFGILILMLALLVFATTAGGRGWHAGQGLFAADSETGPSAEQMQTQVEFAARWMLRDLDATPEQQEKIHAIAYQAVNQVHAMRDVRDALAVEVRMVAAQETIDRDAIERIRGARMALLDSASREVSRSIADALEILTLEQRIELLERLDRHHR